jgi:hypothetical protein
MRHYYVMLHFYLQQPGIIKMFLLCNIPGNLVQTRYNPSKLYAKHHKYYISLRNLASVLNMIHV